MEDSNTERFYQIFCGIAHLRLMEIKCDREDILKDYYLKVRNRLLSDAEYLKSIYVVSKIKSEYNMLSMLLKYMYDIVDRIGIRGNGIRYYGSLELTEVKEDINLICRIGMHIRIEHDKLWSPKEYEKPWRLINFN